MWAQAQTKTEARTEDNRETPHTVQDSSARLWVTTCNQMLAREKPNVQSLPRWKVRGRRVSHLEETQETTNGGKTRCIVSQTQTGRDGLLVASATEAGTETTRTSVHVGGK